MEAELGALRVSLKKDINQTARVVKRRNPGGCKYHVEPRLKACIQRCLARFKLMESADPCERFINPFFREEQAHCGLEAFVDIRQSAALSA